MTTTFTGSPADLSANQPQAPQISEQDIADFTRVAKQLSSPQLSAPSNDADPARFQAVATALKNLGPDMLDRLHDDPAGASATLDGWIRSNIQNDSSYDATALHNAYKSVYGERSLAVPGGKYDQQQYMQWLASQRSEYGNFAAGVSHGAANVGLDVAGVVAPQSANRLGENVNDVYNPDLTRTSGKAGEFAGGTVASLPAMLVPGAAVPAFAAMGAGAARREVAQRRSEGQDIGTGQEALYAGTTGAIQGIVAHYLSRIMNGSPGQVPLQNMIRTISPQLLESIQGTDGAVLRPVIQRTLLNAGVGASQNEIAMIAQEIAKSGEGITGDNDPSVLDRIAKATPGTLLEGGIQGGGFGLIHEAKTPGQFGKVETGEPITDANGPPLHQTAEGFVTEPGRQEQPVKSLSSVQPLLSDKSDFFDDNQPPAEPRANDTEELTNKLRQQATESDEVLQRVNAALENGVEPLKGQLPNTTDLRTGEAEHPLVARVRRIDPKVAVSDPGEHADLFADVERATGKKIIPITSSVVNGFASPEHPDSILVDTSDPTESIWNVVAHEIGHTLQHEFPALFKQLHDSLPQWFRKAAETDYKKRFKGIGYSDEQTERYWNRAGQHEIVSTAFGESASKSKMLQRQLRGDNTSMWDAMRSAVERVLNKFTSRGRIINAISDSLRTSLGIREAKASASKGGSQRVRDEARQYMRGRGLSYSEVGNQPLNVERSKQVASAYEQLKHEPEQPDVKASYAALKKETLDQFNFLRDKGVKFEPWTGGGQPYKNSQEMMTDVDRNKHLFIFTGGEMPADHPLAESSGINIGGKALSHNDVFRAVHDYFGHTREGFQFGPRGEDNAYRAHSSMYSEAARPAMTTETRGQNSYVNFGPNGEHNRSKPTETIYADQKAGILPEEFYSSKGNQAPRSYLSIGHKFRGDGSEELWWEKGGKVVTAETDRGRSTHVDYGHEVSEADFRGRVDKINKEISVAVSPEVAHDTARLRGIEKQLLRKYPDHQIFVAERGGLTPIEELTSGNLYPTLDKVKGIEEDKPIGEKAKEIYNDLTPSNAWKFTEAVGDKLRRGLSDSLADFIDAARAIDKLKDISKVPLEAYIRLHGGLTDRIGKMRQYGLRRLFGDAYIDPQTNKPMNREWQLDPVKSAVERLGNGVSRSVKRKEAYDFTNFATRLGVAESTIERAYRKGQKSGAAAALDEPLTGIGGTSGKDDVLAAKKFIEDARKESNYDLAQEFLRRYRLMGTAHLDVLVQGGRISRQTAGIIRKSNEFYTDLHRVMEKTGTLDPSQTPGSGILHKFRGSNREIDNPYINQQLTTERSYQVAERNYVLSEFIKQATDHLSEKPTIVDKEGNDTITVYDKGEKKFYKVDPLVAEAVNGWGKHVTPDGVRLLGKVLGAPGRMWMFLTHKNPFYHLNNIVKDMRSRSIISKESGGLKSVGTELEGLKDRDTRELVEVLGGTFGGRGEYAKSRAAYERITKKALNDLAGDPNVIVALPQKAWKGFTHFTEISESVGRTAEYKAQFDAAKKRGMADQDARTYAAWKARDLMDFAVSGTWIKAINEIAYVPVLNSQFRGLSKHLETIRSDPTNYAKRMVMFGMIPALIPAIWAHAQGKDQWEKYKSIPLVQRIMFDNYMIGNQRLVIPRGEMVASASMMHELLFQNHFDVNDLFRALAATQVPSQVENPTSLLPLHGVFEAKSNYSWFYNRNIIPPDEEGVALDLRKTDSASPLAKAISFMAQKAGMELDPRKIEHVINADLGTFGGVMNTASRIGSDKGMSPSKKLQMLGGYERTTPGYTDQEVQRTLQTADRYKDSSSPAVRVIKDALSAAGKAPDVDARQKFVDQAHEAATAENAFYDEYGDTLMQVKKIGMGINDAKQEYDSLKTGQERIQYLRDNPDKAKLLRQDSTYERVNARIGELRKAIVSPVVSDSTKTLARKELKRLYNLLLQMG